MARNMARIWAVVLVGVLTMAFAGAGYAFAAQGDYAASASGSALSAQSIKSTQTVSKAGSTYALLAKNGYLYPCNSKGKRIASSWDAYSRKTPNRAVKVFVAANAKKVSDRVSYRMAYRFSGTSTYRSSLASLRKLKNVTFLLKKGKNSCTAIENYALKSSSLKSITNLKKTKVKSIGKYSFARTKLTSIALPSTLKTIGDHAFSRCSSLKTVNGLGKTKVTKIGVSAFFQCGVKSIVLPGVCEKVCQCAFYKCRKLASVTFGPKVSLVDSSAFCGCRALTKVDLPASVKEIGTDAFQNCASLSSLTMRSTTMVVRAGGLTDSMTSIIEGTAIAKTSRGAIYVPASLLNDYQEPLGIENPWYEYADKFKAIA